jgi:hypothetical protein
MTPLNTIIVAALLTPFAVFGLGMIERRWDRWLLIRQTKRTEAIVDNEEIRAILSKIRAELEKEGKQ